MLKPNPEVYRETLARLKRHRFAPEEILFIDDTPENISAARDECMIAVHARGFEAVREILSRLRS